MTLRSLLVAGALTMAAGCVTQPLDGPIDYQVTSGLGGNGDGTAVLHIDADGTLTRTPPAGPIQVGVLDAATARELRREIALADFPSLSDDYACVGQTCNDTLIHVVSVELGGAVHTVQVDELASAPKRLEALLETLHDLATLEVP